MKTRHAALMAILLSLVLAVFFLVTPIGAEDGEVVEVTATGEFTFEPETITVEPGTTVRWVWEGGGRHTVTSSDSIESGKRTHNGLFKGEVKDAEGFRVYEHTFEETGGFPYFCEPHTGLDMVGTVVVQQAVGGGTDETRDSPGPAGVLVFGAVWALIARARRR